MCLSGGLASVVLTFLVMTRRITSPAALEASMTVGLVAGMVVTFVTGAVWPDTLWITCGYAMVLTVTAGVTLRNGYVFGSVLAVLFAAWAVAVMISPQHLHFQGDANTLVIVGGVVSIASFSLLKGERATQRVLNEQLREQLDFDSLTGALNRTGLLGRLEGLHRSEGCWCAYADVDFFKSINDRMGHDYGDEVLRAIATGLVEVCGEEALVARWGGDEFVVICRGEPPVETDVEQKVRACLSRKDLDATLTVGVTTTPAFQLFKPDEAIDRADRRMYERRDAVRAG